MKRGRCVRPAALLSGGAAVPKAAVDTKVIASACDGIALFQGLHKDDRTRLYESMYQLEYSPGEDIIKQGEDGRNFYVVVEGSLTLLIKKEGGEDFTKKLFPGDTFGEVGRCRLTVSKPVLKLECAYGFSA